MNFSEIYSREITQESYKELINLCKWFNNIVGYYPTIIGGWAAFFYYPGGLGSRDIDVVFPDRELRERWLYQYAKNHGYYRRGKNGFGLEVEYCKTVITNSGIDVDILIDTPLASDITRIRNSKYDIRFQYGLALKYQKQMNREDDGENIYFYIPIPEMLLVFKAKAAFDRKYDSGTKYDPIYVQNKIEKDYYDIISILLHQQINQVQLREILELTNFIPLFYQILYDMRSHPTAMSDHNITWKTIESKIDAIVKS